MKQWKFKKVPTDLGLIFIVLVTSYLVFSAIDMFEAFIAFVEAHESWELDELILTVLLSPLAFLWFIVRRWRDENHYQNSLLKKEKEHSDKLKFDEITGLANSSYFQMIASEKISKFHKDYLSQGKGEVVMVVIEIANGQVVTKGFTEKESEHFIRKCTFDVKEALSKDACTIGRLGTDAFAIVYFSASNAMSQQWLKRLDKTLSTFNSRLNLELNIGVTSLTAQEELKSINALIHRAASAIHNDQTAPNLPFYIYDHQEHYRKVADISRKKELEAAIKAKELILYLQPQVDGISQKLIGAEALIRWDHPVNGIIPPFSFIDLAHNNYLAIEIGEFVIEQALQLIAEFDNKLSISINIFPFHIQQANFPERLNALVSKFPASNPENLLLEVTEIGAIESYEQVRDNMQQCIKLGVRFSLDDFGTGHSSLNQLRTLPVSEIKIDRSFISHFLLCANDKKMVQSIRSLAKTFNLDVIAEGIETPEQRDALVAMKLHRQQGYLYSKPLAKNEFLKWRLLYEKKIA